MKTIIGVLLLCCSLAGIAQQKTEYILLGPITTDSLMHDTACKWFQSPPSYTPYAEYTNKLAEKADSIFIKIYCGNWCEDTQRELPRFIKTAQASRLNFSLYFLDRDKHSPQGLEQADNILFVPTFIVMKNGKEVGRVVESAPYGIEKHLVDLLKK